MSPSSPTSFPLSVTFHSDWGVTTGTGVAGGVDSVVEKDERGLPIVRATVLAGVVREQSLLAAQALDDGSGRSGAPSPPPCSAPTWRRGSSPSPTPGSLTRRPTPPTSSTRSSPCPSMRGPARRARTS